MKSKPLTLHKENYFPAQWEFLTNKKKARVKSYVGGFGSGKTHSFLTATFINLVTKKNKDGKSNGLIFVYLTILTLYGYLLLLPSIVTALI